MDFWGKKKRRERQKKMIKGIRMEMTQKGTGNITSL